MPSKLAPKYCVCLTESAWLAWKAAVFSGLLRVYNSHDSLTVSFLSCVHYFFSAEA